MRDSTKSKDQNLWFLRILATTDLHMCIDGFDFLSETRSHDFGLSALAGLINKQRQESACILVDNGDCMQSAPLGEFVANTVAKNPHATNPMITAMNKLQFDAATVGNHDFDFGIGFLKHAVKSAKFPFLCANIRPVNNDLENWPLKTTIINRTLMNNNGDPLEVRIGLLGLAPTETVNWNWHLLKGRVIAEDLLKSARSEAKNLRRLGADIVVAMAHTGLTLIHNLRHSVGHVGEISKIPEIDAIVAGHDHDFFPTPNYPVSSVDPADKVEVDTGRINGKPVVQSGHHGRCLGLIDLKIDQTDGKIDLICGSSRLLFTDEKPNSSALPIENMAEYRETKAAMIAHNSHQIATVATPMTSFFEGATNSCALRLILCAQYEGSKEMLSGTEYAHLPIITCASPQRIGFGGDAENFTCISPGPFYQRDIPALYQYADFLHGVVITKSALVNHLELAASVYNKITPNAHHQELYDRRFSLYSLNTFLGVKYEFDLTRSARFNPDFTLNNSNHGRVCHLTLNGREISDNQQFVLTMNTYRAGGGGEIFNYPFDRFVVQSRKKIPDMIVSYLSALTDPWINLDAVWRIKGLDGTSASFKSAARAKEQFIKYPRKDVSFENDLGDGFAQYRYHFSTRD